MAIIVISVMLVLLIAVIGFGIDMSRLILARQTMQVQVEAAALAAALVLDGSENGGVRAWAEAAKVQGARVEYGQKADGPWQLYASVGTAVRCVKVATAVVVPLTLMRSIVEKENVPVPVTAIACRTESGSAELTR